MKRAHFFFFTVLFLFGVSPFALALLAQSVPPENTRLTVYRNANVAWVEGVFELRLPPGENRLLFPQEESFAGRLFLKPLTADVELVKTEPIPEGTALTVKTQQEGTYPLLLGFFLSGFNWEETYFGHLDGSILSLSPAVFVENESSQGFENVVLSWLSGSPIFLEEDLFETRAELEAAAMAKAPSGAPAITMERVSEYERYTLKETVDIPPQTVLQVFPETRTFSVERLIRYENEGLQPLLIFENQGEPLPAGTMFLAVGDTIGTIAFPGIRSGETLELPLPLSPQVSIARRVREYFREEAHFTEDQELTGFTSAITVTFTIENFAPEKVTLEIRETLLSPETPLLPPEWQWQNGQARTRVSLSPGEKTTLTLSYRFKEALP